VGLELGLWSGEVMMLDGSERAGKTDARLRLLLVGEKDTVAGRVLVHAMKMVVFHVQLIKQAGNR
jgi:hypothetical protein